MILFSFETKQNTHRTKQRLDSIEYVACELVDVLNVLVVLLLSVGYRFHDFETRSISDGDMFRKIAYFGDELFIALFGKDEERRGVEIEFQSMMMIGSLVGVDGLGIV